MKRHLGRLRHRPRPEDLVGVDDCKVTVAAIEQDLALRTVKLSGVKMLAVRKGLTRGADLLLQDQEALKIR